MPPAEPMPSSQWESLKPLVYEELRRVAISYFSRQPAGFTLRPTEIVHEACLHLMQHSDLNWTSTAHFRAIAVKKMWQVVIDHMRQRQAQKRGGVGRFSPHEAGGEAKEADPGARQAWQRVPLDHITVEWGDRPVDLLDLADALALLAKESNRLHDVVTLHWFGGMTYAEVAETLDISRSTAEKDFRYALAWLKRCLEAGKSDGH